MSFTAMPWRRGVTGPWGSRVTFRDKLLPLTRFQPRNVYISGVTRDASGAALAGVTVKVFRCEDNCYIGQTVSLADGTWTFTPGVSGTFECRADLAGVPARAGASSTGIAANA